MWPSTKERNFLSDIRWARVREKIERGNEELQEATVAREDLELAREAGDVHAVRLKQLRERVYRHQLAASTYFEDAHRLQLRLLKGALKKASPSEYDLIKDDLRKQFQKGRVLRKRAVRSVPQMSPENMVREAAYFESEALEKLLQATLKAKGYAMPEEELIAQKPDQDAEGVATPVPEEIPDSLKPDDPKDVKSQTPSVSDTVEREIFFSIQFLATREPVSDRRVKSVYHGPLPVIKTEGEGWYRFSAGRFSSVEDALEEKERAGIYGFIVAFRNGERISIARARKFLEVR